jgi:putative methyltransferase (TIGR04325 family)
MFRRLLSLLPSERLEGYEHPELVEVVFRKTIAYRPQAPWPEIAGSETVLDFGGGCGIHYKQAALPAARWAVVETPAMVRKAKELETDRLRFFTSIDAARGWLGNIDVMHSNGAIQYTPNPLAIVRQLIETSPRRLLWSRLNFDRAGSQTSRLIDNGPGKVSGIGNKMITYPIFQMSEAGFHEAHSGYTLEARGADWARYRVDVSASSDRGDSHIPFGYW